MSSHRNHILRRPSLTTGAFALLALAASAPLFAQTTPAASAAKPDEVVQLEKFVAIGSRFNDRTVTDSPVPIDVLSGVDIQNNGYTELGQTPSVLVPSIDFPRPANTDGTDTIRPARSAVRLYEPSRVAAQGGQRTRRLALDGSNR